VKLSDFNSSPDKFLRTNVEEMDFPKNCFGQDTRYTNGKGYYSKRYPGMIFQEGNVPGFVGKIRLTKEFKGKLPNGASVDLSAMKLRNVFEIYPELKDLWTSRGCSDYWRIGNDTIAFYVKIDKSIQPQYPVRESDYLDKPIEGVDFVTSCHALLAPDHTFRIGGNNKPIIYVDSIRVNANFLQQVYTPEEFYSITVIKGEKAIEEAGEEGRNGIVHITTHDSSRIRYWNLFRSISETFAKEVTSPYETDVTYILDDKVLTKKNKSELYSLTKEDIVEIEVLHHDELSRRFGESTRVGVVVRTKK
jgi:hypothetical protein